MHAFFMLSNIISREMQFEAVGSGGSVDALYLCVLGKPHGPEPQVPHTGEWVG